MKRFARFMVFLLLVLVVLAGFLFVINNDTQTGLWLGMDLEARSVGVWVLASFTVGGLLGLILGLGLWSRLRMKLELQRTRKQLEQCRNELDKVQQ